MKYKLLFLGVCFSISLSGQTQKTVRIKPFKSIATAIPEPSDSCFDKKTNHFFVVSDNGVLFETDHDGIILRQKAETNSDYEAVYVNDDFVYAVDETHRNIHIYDRNTLECSKIINVPYSGGRNSGYEALTFNPVKQSWLLFTEKNPVTLFELDAQFVITNQIALSALARDISAATFYEGFLWLLSDEDRTVFKLDPKTYQCIGRWELPLINPEGLAFDAEGKLLISCDDMQRMYYFNNPEKP